MIADLSSLVRLTKAQIKPAAEMLARALQNDPACTYCIPNTTERKNKSHILFENMVRFGVLYGEVYATSHNLEGVVSWVPSDKADLTIWRIIRSGYFSILFRLGRKNVSRIMSYGDYASLMHKRHAPFRHWYLMIIGVDPMYQGRGYASALMKPMLARIDNEQMPCYVETNNERNVPIFQHYGFRIAEVGIPGTNVNHWAMLREKSR